MKRILFITCICLAACSKDKKDDPGTPPLPFTSIGSSKDQPGIGDNDGEPLGTPFTLPPGIRIVPRPHHPFDPDTAKLFGNMNAFYVDVSFVNDSAKGPPVQVTFPPGFVMLNVAPSRIQNGMLMGRVRINVPPQGIGPGGVKDTLTVYLGVACINEAKGLPWGDQQAPDEVGYPIAKGLHVPLHVTSDRNLLKFLSLLEDKPKLELTSHLPENQEIYDLIQNMLWKVTDGDGMSKEDIEELKAALAPYK